MAAQGALFEEMPQLSLLLPTPPDSPDPEKRLERADSAFATAYDDFQQVTDAAPEIADEYRLLLSTHPGTEEKIAINDSWEVAEAAAQSPFAHWLQHTSDGQIFSPRDNYRTNQYPWTTSVSSNFSMLHPLEYVDGSEEEHCEKAQTVVIRSAGKANMISVPTPNRSQRSMSLLPIAVEKRRTSTQLPDRRASTGMRTSASTRDSCGQTTAMKAYNWLTKEPVPVVEQRPEEQPDCIGDRIMANLGFGAKRRAYILIVGMNRERGQSGTLCSLGNGLAKHLLSCYNVHVEYADPFVDQDEIPFLPRFEEENWRMEALEAFDAIVVTVKYQHYAYPLLARLERRGTHVEWCCPS